MPEWAFHCFQSEQLQPTSHLHSKVISMKTYLKKKKTFKNKKKKRKKKSYDLD